MLDLKLFFPTVISWDSNKELASKMLPYANKYLNKVELLTSQLEYTSTYNPDGGLEQYDEFKPFVDFITSKGAEYLDKCGYDSSAIELHPQIFASSMKHGDSHTSHIHPNSLLSGVFYLTAPDGASPIVFSDIRHAKRMVSLPIKEDNVITDHDIPIFPEEGLLVLWESWMPHSVPKNKSDSERVTLVFNLSTRY